MEKGTNELKEKNEVKKEKKFNKKWMIILIIVAVAALGIAYIVVGNKGEKYEKIDLSATQLGKYLPELPSTNGKITYDSERYLNLDLYNISKEQYNNYKKKCEQKGFNIDVSSSSTFEAYNEESYRLYMYTSENTIMHIGLTVPEELKEITWPTSELANSVPVPKYDGGYIITDKSNEMSITIGNMTKEHYDKYVNECSAKGYNINYDKSNKTYKADNANGNHLEVSYYGGRRVNIKIKANTTNTNSSNSTQATAEVPAPIETPAAGEETKIVEQEDNNSASNSSGISQEFKNAMDSYEAVMDEYVEFMKKYQANSTDVSLINQYATIMQKYSEQVSAFEKWDSTDMTKEETQYYIDVQARVNKKLLEVAQ